MHIVDKLFTRVVFDPNGPVKIAVIYDRKEALHIMIRYLNISDNRAYVVNLSPPGTGCGERKKKRPALIRQI